ncbi:MAG: hypothetical protein GKR90_27510 [Pseudomonadales bacterium]|nr:hypothetical protein [Pseudomonadales bacterium]
MEERQEGPDEGRDLRGIKYDIVLLDAFNAEYIPEHLLSSDFFDEIKSILTPDGVLGSNTFASSALYDHESVTYHAVFGDFFNVQIEGKTSNRVVLAGAEGKPDVEYIRANALRWAKHFYGSYTYPYPPGLARDLAGLYVSRNQVL